MQQTIDRVNSYRTLVREAEPDEYRRELRSVLKDEQWWHRHLELSHKIFCLGAGGVQGLSDLKEHWEFHQGRENPQN